MKERIGPDVFMGFPPKKLKENQCQQISSSLPLEELRILLNSFQGQIISIPKLDRQEQDKKNLLSNILDVIAGKSSQQNTSKPKSKVYSKVQINHHNRVVCLQDAKWPGTHRLIDMILNIKRMMNEKHIGSSQQIQKEHSMRQVHPCEFEDSLIYTISSRPASHGYILRPSLNQSSIKQSYQEWRQWISL